ncbi:hypothetical protein TVAG_267260 [Trichomonas vaginalis G3]|uniref:Uncharacterized protein n=1 Tax=Trichomonas vaginalis (strain ATCC PRA-98 / G3) TaxID=412133 RepID=A2F564_TRIV3|nr:hypothetical protein TVAGG3_0496010 [Trichomonas vaginalis G3]EAX99957.1 hypothetical protein TVAG_267260 [Trichomonas vaginalis G3]KAI5516722.1 hypothetical protein TVAGG3_0496010 [Trichomonas vaginalis G3]|eukprot:XP_001312887.1 hypothetical protein [Trichomonas vaginalis G3]
MKCMKDYIKLAAKKKLNRAERRSLISSISACKNFGTNADEFLSKADVYDSIIYTYCRALRRIGIPFTSFRETERYKFMLSLSIQQTWDDGLGSVLSNTLFLNCKDYPISNFKEPSDPYHAAYQSLLKGVYPMDVAAKLRAQEDERIKWISVYCNQNRVIIASYIKKTNKFSLNRCLSTYNGMIEFTDEDIYDFEKGRNTKQPIKTDRIDPEILLNHHPTETPQVKAPVIKCVSVNVPIKVHRIKVDEVLKFPQIPRPCSIFERQTL